MLTKTAIEIYPQEAWDLADSLTITRSLTMKEREKIDDSDFAWPDAPDHPKYPIDTQDHLDAAAKLLGRAPENVQAKIKARAKAIAKRKGFTLPDSWKEEDGDRIETPIVIRADGSHDPMTGKHSHPHTANGEQGDDSTHEHEHSHDGDADHGHTHEERTDTPEITRAVTPTHAALYAPIVRIDKERREVEGVATSEAVDSFGTIFSYEASKKAFQRWMERTANVREMHDRKAIGKGIGVRFDDAEKKIYLRSRISRGATDSWLKIEDGVLNGYSVGATNPVWDTIERDGKKYPYLTSYDLAETSIVDNASNPDGQGLVIARAEGLTEVIDTTEDIPPSVVVASPVERAGARVSGDTRAALHDARNHQILGAMKTMKTCRCDECMGAFNVLDPDDDNDIDWMGLYDPDGDAASLQPGSADDMDRAVTSALERMLPGLVERILSPIYLRQQQFLARMAQMPEPEPPTIDTAALEERLTTAIVERVASAASQSEVHASLSEQAKALEAVKETVERIAAQPMPGGPVLNGGVPIDRSMATGPARGQTEMDARRAFFDDLQRRGLLTTSELQMAAAEASLVRLPGRTG